MQDLLEIFKNASGLWAAIGWIASFLPRFKDFTTWLKSQLEAVKTVQEIAKTSQDLLKGDKKEDTQVVEKVKANAELIRSYTGIAVIEYLVWLTKTLVFFIPVLLFFRLQARFVDAYLQPWLSRSRETDK